MVKKEDGEHPGRGKRRSQRPEERESREFSKTRSISKAKVRRWSSPISVILAKLKSLDF